MLSELITQRLIIRRLGPADAEALYAYRTEPDVLRFQTWAPASVQEVREFIERLQTIEPLTPGDWFQIGIMLRATGELVGDFGLQARVDDPRLVEIGITLAPRFQHQGLATEALRALLVFLFTRTETHRVHCSVDPQNHSCLRLLEKVGMRREGHLIESLWLKGAWVDDVIYAMLRREWESNPDRR